MFKLHAPYQPKGDQPKAIEELVKGIKNGKKEQVLLGATGTGKTFKSLIRSISFIKFWQPLATSVLKRLPSK